ncbi:PilZ domain-containing protein [Sphingomonas antarctica]|uniref:PilZ domain-containing protein n=1 Tax=Sphingomonas antarctica TaxID=2040274 RepID=UPI0039EBD343
MREVGISRSLGSAALRRSDRRYKIFRRGTWREGGSEFILHLLDISVSGARAHTTNSPHAQTIIDVECLHPLGTARVCWVAGNTCGLQFLSPLTADIVTDILGSLAEPPAIVAGPRSRERDRAIWLQRRTAK